MHNMEVSLVHTNTHTLSTYVSTTEITRLLCAGSQVHHFHQQTLSMTKNKGNGKTVRVNVKFTFRKGTFLIGQKETAYWTDADTQEKLNVSHGFRPQILYKDGEGNEPTNPKNYHHCHSASMSSISVFSSHHKELY